MIELRVLGTLDLRDRATNAPVASVLAQPKRTALLAWLAIARPRGAHRRDTVLGLFWPESPEQRGRNSLNQAIFNLRRSLGDTSIESSGDEIRLDPARVWCDAVEFERTLASGDPDTALTLYGGELLPGLHIDGCPDFEHWVDGERERLRRSAVTAALQLARTREDEGRGVAAVELLRRASGWAPYSEEPAHRLIELLAQFGDHAGALREAVSFAERVERELGDNVSAGFVALTEQVRHDVAAQARLAAIAPPPTAPPPATLTAPFTVEPSPLAQPEGRRRVSRTAAAALGTVALALAAAGAAGLPARIAHLLGPKTIVAAPQPRLDMRRVFVAALDNRTGDAANDHIGYMAADRIAGGLAHSGVARVVPFSTVVQEMLFLPADPAQESPGSALRRAAGTSGAGMLLTGAYYRIAEGLVFQAQIIDVSSGELIRGIEVLSGSAADAVAAVDELQRRSVAALATRYDERLDSWPDRGDQPSSLQAYQLFGEGMRLFMAANNHFGSERGNELYAAAAAEFMAAASLDSAFVAASLWAVYALANAGDATAAGTLAGTLVHRAHTPWTRTVLSHQLAALARDDEAAYHAALQLADLSPDSEWLTKLAHSAYRIRRYGEALDAYRRVDPDHGWIRGWSGYWRLRAELQHITGDYRAALADTRRGLAEYPDDSWLATQELWALAALGRSADIIDRIGTRIDAAEPFAIWQLGTVLEAAQGHGRRAAARRLIRELLPRARAAAATSSDARPDLAYALFRADRFDEARMLYHELAAERPRALEFRARLAMIDAARGERNGARTVMDTLDGLDADAILDGMPAGQLRYWGTAEAWRALLRARLAVAVGDDQAAISAVLAATASGVQHAWLHLHDDPDFLALRNVPAFRSLLDVR
jgi:DNA-binding SARP family transcriptional activator/tetratricopeptide (TPR) repeat protein